MSTCAAWFEIPPARSRSCFGSSLVGTQAGSDLESEPRAAERPHAVLLLGRERVRDVLEPHLGASCALERANNIAQALALADAQPDAVAFEMLRQVPQDTRRKLAAAVRREWLAVEFDQFRARRTL